MCLGNISKGFTVDNMGKAGINGCVTKFSVDYNNIDVDDILNIQKYSIKKHNIKQCLDLLKKYFLNY